MEEKNKGQNVKLIIIIKTSKQTKPNPNNCNNKDINKTTY